MLGLRVFELLESAAAVSGSLLRGQCSGPHSVMSIFFASMVQQSPVRRIVEPSSFLDCFLYLNIKLSSATFLHSSSTNYQLYQLII
jgi:hypothetical protein